MPDKEVLLRLENVTVARASQVIVRDLDLAIGRRRIHALVGANGSGKSTLAQAVMGSAGFDVVRGRILLEGRDVTHLSITERARLGMTLAMQEPARFEGLRVGRYLALGMAHPDEEQMAAALRQVQLVPADYVDRLLDEGLSGGERKRIELAAVLCMRPKVAILDECDSGIDTHSLQAVARAIRQLARQGAAVLLISHSAELAASADAASLLVKGRITQTGSARHIAAQYARAAAAAGTPAAAPLGSTAVMP